jgi:hypothetical protein
MKITWTKGLSPERSVEVKKDFVGSVILRKRLKELLEEKMKGSRDSSISKEGYSNPNWAYLQADARGYERALNEVISLIESEK